jgi:tetratricopeptide (TPR) repeat protein/DNA-binding PadR family transcriptional regulator
MAMSKKSVKVGERIILHLSQFTNYRGKRVVPSQITQEGMAEVIGVKRPHVSVELGRLMEKGLVEEFKAHAGGRKKKKAYALTSKGLQKYNEILVNLKEKKISVHLEDTSMKMNGKEASDYLSSKMGLPYVIAVEIVMENDEITQKTIDEKKETGRKVFYSSPIPKVSKLLGREAEMERIHRWYRGKARMLSVVGTAGIGKTALIASFVSTLKSPVFWHRIGEWEGFMAVLSDLSDFLSKNGRLSLKNYLASPNPDLGIVGRIIRNIDEKQTWVFDDYQKASEPVKELLNMIFDSIKDTPIKIIVISRSIPDFYSRKDVILKKQVYELFLSGLSMDSARELLISKASYMGEENFREIYEFTGGHPLALELIAFSGMNKYSAKAYITEEIYNKLSNEERKMLSEISVYRRHVSPDAFLRTEKDFDTLRSLLKKGIVYYDTNEKYFTHDIMKAFLKERFNQKREHLKAYRYLKGLPEIRDRIEAIYHALMADRYEDAESLALTILDEAITKGFGNDLLSVLNTKEVDNFGIIFAKAKALQATGHIKDAEKLVKKLVRTSKGEEKAKAMSLLGLIYTNTATIDEAVEILEKALKRAKSEELRAEIMYNLGMAHFRAGRYDDAEKELMEAVEMYTEMKNYVKAHRIKAQYASVLAGKGREEEAINMLKELAEFFGEREDYRVLGNIYNNMGTYQARKNMRIEALASLEKAALYADLSGHRQLLGYALMNSANNYLVLGAVEKALMMAERAEKVMEEIGDKRGLGILKTVIAEAHELMGDDSEKYYEEAERALLEMGLKRQVGELYMEREDIAKDGEKRMEYYKKAMEIFKEVKYESGIRRIEERIGES